MLRRARSRARVGRLTLGVTAGVIGLLIAPSCTVGERPTLTDDAVGAGSIGGGEASAETVIENSAGTSTASASTDPPAESDSDGTTELGDTAALGDAPPVVTTSTGVLVPVLGRSETGLMVNTPCGHEAEIIWGQPVAPVDVVIDAGHGGDETGALGPNGETEAEVNLDLARRTAALLERRGLTVALTRTADYRITISNRAAIADRLGAKAFVSIHHNSPTPSTPNEAGTPGTEVYPQVGSEEASRLGGLIYADVVAALAPFDIEWSAAANAGVIQVINSAGEDAYGIVRRPSVPTALVELAYLSNPPEALLIGTVDYRQTAAAALAQGIARFVNTADVGTGFVEEPRLTDPSAETGGSDGCIDPPLE